MCSGSDASVQLHGTVQYSRRINKSLNRLVAFDPDVRSTIQPPLFWDSTHPATQRVWIVIMSLQCNAKHIDQHFIIVVSHPVVGYVQKSRAGCHSCRIKPSPDSKNERRCTRIYHCGKSVSSSKSADKYIPKYVSLE